MCFFADILVGQAVQAKSFRRFQLTQGLSAKLKKRKYKRLYDAKTGQKRIFGNQIIVKFKKNFNKAKVRSFATENNLRLRKKIGKRTYVFSDFDQKHLLTTVNTLTVDKNLKAKNEIASVDIDEYKILNSSKRKNKKFSLEAQWHLKNNGRDSVSLAGADINIEPAWNTTQGEGVIVAVIDTGFDVGHKDINFLNSGYSVVDGNYNANAPYYSSENHGTAVAGIIASKDNKKGTVGVAPKAKILPIRLISDRGMVPVSNIIEAHQKAVEMGAQIINNSWGTYDSSLDDDEQLELSNDEENLYRYLADDANNGKGVTVIFAAGNSSDSNLNAHPEARSEYTLAVGAIDSTDKRASYSAYGSELDFVAPGGDYKKGMSTTDRRDKGRFRSTVGYARGSYTDTFTGTSAAAPVVSGVAALVLSTNPRLNAAQVKSILRQSARKDLNNYYDFSSGKSNEIGYGIIDAAAAVELAKRF